MTRGDIHNRQRTFQRLKNRIKKNPEISDRDKDLLIHGTDKTPSFLAHLRQQDMSKSRINRYLRTWKRLSQHTNWNIEDVDKTKMTELIGEIHQDVISRKDGEPFAAATKREIKKGIRKMYVDYVEVYQEELEVSENYSSDELINFTLTIDRKFTDSDQLPTPYTVEKLVNQANSTRDKAYIMLLWSTGGRHGEILGLKWKDVSFTNSVGKVTFRDTKTGGDHTVPMGEAYPFMMQHQENDPESKNPDAYVFRSHQSNEQFTGSGAANIIVRARKKTDIPDKIKTNPHAFRKGRTSYWARQDKSEAWICKHMNWAQGSQVVRHYCRLAQGNVEKGVAEHLGLKHEEKDNRRQESQVLTPGECHNCGSINTFTQNVCSECGEALSTGRLFEKAHIEEKTQEFQEEIIRSNTEFKPEEINEKAKEFVAREFEL